MRANFVFAALIIILCGTSLIYVVGNVQPANVSEVIVKNNFGYNPGDSWEVRMTSFDVLIEDADLKISDELRKHLLFVATIDKMECVRDKAFAMFLSLVEVGDFSFTIEISLERNKEG